MKLSGAQILINCLVEQGVNTIFGYPGASILSVYDALDGSPVRHILAAHEQGACFAASGYARASGKAGVVLATSGPGATNLVTGIADAFMDSVPLIAITGNVPVSNLGHDSFQEVDTFGITMPVSKYGIIVKSVDELAFSIRKAFSIATSGRKGPVLIDVPCDVFDDIADYKREVPKAVEQKQIDNDEIEKAVALINSAKHPVIYAGGGVKASGAEKELADLALKICAPVTVSYMGIGTFNPDDAAYLGVLSNANPTPTQALKECDLLITLGARFNSRYNAFNLIKKRKIPLLQIDIDNAEIDKNVLTTASVSGDVKQALNLINPLVNDCHDEEWAFRDFEQTEVSGRGIDAIKCLSRLLGADVIVSTDVGLHQEWTALNYRFTKANNFLTSGGLGCMGFGLGAAIGAHLATGKKCLLITGDGSFNMNFNELATAVKHHVPLIVVIMDNHSLGMIRRLQLNRAGKKTASSSLYVNANYPALANAFGIRSVTIEETDDLETALKDALKGTLPVVIDLKISINEGI